MTPQEAHNTLQWVAALLSGEYKHGTTFLYNPTNNTHSALGVALRIAQHPTVYDNNFAECYPVLRNRYVNPKWLSLYFGIDKPPGFFNTMNDLTKDYYTVAAHLINLSPESDKRQELWFKLMREYHKSNSNAKSKGG